MEHLVWNVGCKLQKNHKSKRRGVEGLLELSSYAMKYADTEERLMELLSCGKLKDKIRA